MRWDSAKVLITGAGGFIGSHITERLVTLGASTRALIKYNANGRWGWLDFSPHKNQVEFFLGDLRDRDSLKKAFKGVDVVFHLGALISIPYSYEGPLSYVHTNIEGSMNVFQAALNAEVGLVVHTSTSEVYGSAQYVPIDENHPLQGQSPYSASKIGADKMAEAYHLSFGLPVVTVRPFNTYGPRQSARAVIPTIITQALTQKEIKLGSLEPTRDLNFVGDTVNGFIRAAECTKAIGKVINIGSGKEISIRSEDHRIRPSQSEVDRLCADNSLAKHLLDWKPEYTLMQGLSETLEWIKLNIDRFKPNRYAI
jgi:NAD dependent epimerase/dehydratase